jgi:hypothetical protein
MKRFTMVVAGLGMLFFTATAQALPLCGAGSGPCRDGLAFGAFFGGLAVEGRPCKGEGRRGSYRALHDVVRVVHRRDREVGRPVAERRTRSAPEASNEDERGLAEAARGVRDVAKLKLQQFTSELAFNTLRNYNTMLTSFMIEVVAFNIDEVEALGGNPDRILEARSRVTKAGLAILKGDVAAAADYAQRAYDLISGDANTGPDCLVGRL